jgi:hypothetical protein
MYLNPTGGTTSCTTRLRGLTTSGASIFTTNLPSGAALIAQSAGTQSFQEGYASLECSTSVDAQAVYSYYGVNGIKLGEATVFSSTSAARVQILADSREGAQVGLAIANDSDQPDTYTITAYDSGGNVVGSSNRTVGARSAVAAFLNELGLSLPANYYGPVIVSSATGLVSIIGLRFTGPAFTTIPETIR